MAAGAGEEPPGVCAEVVVCSEGEWRVSQATQTIEEDGLVQITASLPQLLQRIDSFMRFKRQQVDVSNQVEFCHRSTSEGTCARTTPVSIKRGTHASHIATYRVCNVSGPTSPTLPPMEKLKHDLQPPAVWGHRVHARGSNLLGLQERLGSIENYTEVYEGGPAPRDLLQRVQNLELRLLQLEGQSPEYPRPKVASKCPPKHSRMHPYAPLPSGHPAHVMSHGYRRHQT